MTELLIYALVLLAIALITVLALRMTDYRGPRCTCGRLAIMFWTDGEAVCARCADLRLSETTERIA